MTIPLDSGRLVLGRSLWVYGQTIIIDRSPSPLSQSTKGVRLSDITYPYSYLILAYDIMCVCPFYSRGANLIFVPLTVTGRSTCDQAPRYTS